MASLGAILGGVGAGAQALGGLLGSRSQQDAADEAQRAFRQAMQLLQDQLQAVQTDPLTMQLQNLISVFAANQKVARGVKYHAAGCRQSAGSTGNKGGSIGHSVRFLESQDGVVALIGDVDPTIMDRHFFGVG